MHALHTDVEAKGPEWHQRSKSQNASSHGVYPLSGRRTVGGDLGNTLKSLTIRVTTMFSLQEAERLTLSPFLPAVSPGRGFARLQGLSHCGA